MTPNADYEGREADPLDAFRVIIKAEEAVSRRHSAFCEIGICWCDDPSPNDSLEAR